MEGLFLPVARISQRRRTEAKVKGVRVRMRVRVSVRVRACLRARVRACVRACVRARVRACLDVCVYACVHVHAGRTVNKHTPYFDLVKL